MCVYVSLGPTINHVSHGKHLRVTRTMWRYRSLLQSKTRAKSHTDDFLFLLCFVVVCMFAILLEYAIVYFKYMNDVRYFNENRDAHTTTHRQRIYTPSLALEHALFTFKM
jgi:hypothetical protein